MARTLTRLCGSPPRGHRPAARSGGCAREEKAWDAFLAEGRAAVDGSLAACGGDRDEAVRALAAALSAKFDGPDAPSGGGGPARQAVAAATEAWLSGRWFVSSDREADPRAGGFGPEAMGRFHEAVAGEEGSVYTEPGEIRFMVRRALAEHLASSSPLGAALPRARAFRLLAAGDASLPRVAARLAPGERRAALRRLTSLRALDPACGSGAFLLGLLHEIVRIGTALGAGDPEAIARRAVSTSLFGTDVDGAALAIAHRRLSLEAPGARPNVLAADPLTGDVARDAFDLVIGNPPYLRQERIDRHPGLGPGAKCRIEAAARARWGRDLGISRRADLYIWFFLEGIRLLRPGGTLVLLTSHAWLDLDYGAALRAFLLEEADIRLIVEGGARSFRRASVNATVTVAARRVAPGHPAQPVRFASLHRPFLRAAQGALFTRLDARRAIESPALRLRIASPRDLAPPAENQPAPRWGGPWLRAPEVILRARTSAEGRTVPLGDLAEVVFGLKTGCNDFFYLEDEGPAPQDPGRLRLCRSRLSGERHPIEARFLVPVVTTLKEIACLEVEPQRLRRRLLAIPAAADPRGTSAEIYLRLGERRGVHRLASLATRRPWYAVVPPRGALLLPRRIGERMPVARSQGLAFDNNLFGITPHPGVPLEALQAVLNATITRLEIELSARELTGAQAVADTNVYLVKALPVPRADLLRARADALGRALAPLAGRPAGSIFAEAGRADRHALDALVLGLRGLPEGEAEIVLEALQALVKRRLTRADARSGPLRGKAVMNWK